MRMRKKAWAEPFLAENKHFVLENPAEYKGKWKDILKTDSLHVEIGCGKGDYFIKSCLNDPKVGFVAIERDISCGAVAAKKAINEHINNALMIVKDAINLEEWFEENEIDVIHLNFSDPWPKKGYYKRRLTYREFLMKYKKLLSKNGEIWMKTDNKGLFEFSIVEFSACDYLIKEFSVDYRRDEHDDPITEYENKFMELGQPIYRVVTSKK